MSTDFKRFYSVIGEKPDREKQAIEKQFELFLCNEVKETGRTRQECTNTFIGWYQTHKEIQTPIKAWDIYAMVKSALWCKALALETLSG